MCAVELSSVKSTEDTWEERISERFDSYVIKDNEWDASRFRDEFYKENGRRNWEEDREL